MTTTTHPSGLPEQEPTSPTAAVLCGGEAWAKTGADWESPRELCSWGDLRDIADVSGGATLFDLADLPTGLTEVQKGAVRSMWRATEGFAETTDEADNLCALFPEAFPDDLATVTWKSGDSDEQRNELTRVAKMEGAHVTATRCGATRSGNVHHVERSIRIHLGATSDEVVIDLRLGGWTITVTAPKPADPTGGDPVVLAAVIYTNKRVLFRAEDGKWSNVRGATAGVWSADSLTEIERLSAQTIAELMGGAS